MKKVLFICLGNICRSPLAEAVFADLVSKAGLVDEFIIDSCGTGGWYQGKSPDNRMIQVAGKYGIDMNHLKARQFELADFYEFDILLTMDDSNYADVCQKALDEESLQKVKMFRDYDKGFEGESVPDPYYGGNDGFEKVFAMVKRSCEDLLLQLK